MSIRSENYQSGKTSPEELHLLSERPRASQNHLKSVKSEYEQAIKNTTWMKLLWDSLESG